jgi:8-oxo-dGTP pyrophosphatase MutT (NUDIX family)
MNLEKKDYIKWIRSKVGHEKIFLNYTEAFIVNDNGEFLMQKRVDSKQWGMIGGAIELGESFEESLRREVIEEIGVNDFEIIDFLGAFNNPEFVYPNGDVVQPIDLVWVVKFPYELDLTYHEDETLELAFATSEKLPGELFNEFYREHFKAFDAWKEGHSDLFMKG